MQRIAQIVAASLLAAGLATASTIDSGLTDSLTARGHIVTTGDPNNTALYGTNLNAGYDGVVALLTSSGGLCSGSVIGVGVHVLTAAHCITDPLGNIDVTGIDVAMFPGDGRGLTFIEATDWIVHPDWDGDFFAGNDLAIITLASLVPSSVQRYEIYRETDEFGQVVEIVGFGRSGTGATGDVLPSGTRRRAFNRFEGTFDGNTLLTDFDNGDPAQNLLQALGVTSDLGLGVLEGSTAPGDSGGPGFLGGRVASITSFGATVGPPIDIDDQLNSSYGELAGFTRVSTYQDWITDNTVPEPSTYLLIGSGLALVGLRRRRRGR